jgi:hypothetical protein
LASSERLSPYDQARLKNDTTSDLILTRSAYDDMRVRPLKPRAVIFGMMLSWTPCVLLMAYLSWRAPLEPD